MKKNKKILFVTAMHGDEPIGVEVVEEIRKAKLGRGFSSIIANPKALKKKIRFIDSDLNRIFPGKSDGNYEERKATMIMKKISKFDYVIDLHGTVSRTGVFIIMTRLNLKNLKLALRFNIKRILIWPDSGKPTGSLVTFVRNGMGIEIESGKKSSIGTRKRLKRILVDFLENTEKKIDVNKEIEKREFFTVIGKIKKRNGVDQKFKDWRKAGNFYPLFVGQYPDVACYKLKKLGCKKMAKLCLTKNK